MIRRGGPRFALAILLALALGPSRPVQVEVASGTPLQAVVDRTVSGGTVVLARGVHQGPVRIARGITLRGAPGAVLVAPLGAQAAISIGGDGTAIEDLAIRGGDSGIVVREVEDVILSRVSVKRAGLHGIEVIDASARIEHASVMGLRSPLAQGIEIRNGDGRPDSVVTGTLVEGGMEGIVSHVSEVVLTDNVVVGTSTRGIVVTEMSDGVVVDNRVGPASGAGLYCGDMSRCAFAGNRATEIGSAPGGLSGAGWGLVVTYHATASSREDVLGGATGDRLVSLGAKMSERSPLDPHAPVVLVRPIAISVAVALLLAAAGVLVSRLARRPGRRSAAGKAPVAAGVATTGVLAVQTFHMIEHWLQVYRVHVDRIPSRGGLAGPVVEPEWVHLAYNATLLLLLIGLSFLLGGRGRRAAELVGAAVAVQAWHAVEHVTKVVQHVTSGAKVNDGLLGRFFDLVWYHFTINLAVYGLCLAAAAAMVARHRSRARLGRRAVTI